MSTFMIANDRESILHSLSSVLDSGAECFLLFCCSSEDMVQFKPILPLSSRAQEATAQLLRTFSIPPHKTGYRQLLLAIPLFAENKCQSLSTELYPKVAQALGYSDWRSVERSIRDAIATGFRRRDPEVWARYYLDGKKPPSSKRFIATLAELLERG